MECFGTGDAIKRKLLCQQSQAEWELGKSVIAYGVPCWIHNLQRRFSFSTRDQAWSLKSFCVGEFY